MTAVRMKMMKVVVVLLLMKKMVGWPATWPSKVVLVQLGQVAGASGEGRARHLTTISHHASVVAVPSPLLGQRKESVCLPSKDVLYFLSFFFFTFFSQ